MIFDYWLDPLSDESNKDFPPFLNSFDADMRIYVLVSHHHKDHFNRRIFLWEKRFPNIRFIISQDVYNTVKYMMEEGRLYAGFRPSRKNIFVLSPGEEYRDTVLKVKAFRSTDIGNSYAIEIDAFKVFHAGDLNAWLWLDESSEEEVAVARLEFEEIISEISSEYPSFDLVMFPVDSRLGRDYWWGAKYFVDSIAVSLFLPMHFALGENEKEKEQRRIDAAAFNLFARADRGDYLQLGSTRCMYVRSV